MAYFYFMPGTFPQKQHKLNVHPSLLSQQAINCFPVHFIRHTAIYGANRGTLGLFMKALAFCAFIRNNVINVRSNRRIFLVSIYNGAIHQGKRPFYGSAICNSPFNATFIYCIIRAFGLTSAAVNTFFSYLNCHKLLLMGSELLLHDKYILMR